MFLLLPLQWHLCCCYFCTCCCLCCWCLTDGENGRHVDANEVYRHDRWFGTAWGICIDIVFARLCWRQLQVACVLPCLSFCLVYIWHVFWLLLCTWFCMVDSVSRYYFNAHPNNFVLDTSIVHFFVILFNRFVVFSGEVKWAARIPVHEPTLWHLSQVRVIQKPHCRDAAQTRNICVADGWGSATEFWPALLFLSS